MQPKQYWKPAGYLFPELSQESRRILESLPSLLERVWPLSRKRRRELPGEIRDLSAMLTCQRGELRRNYWNRPGWIAAYLYYFLPWNLVRLCRLLPGLPLICPATQNEAIPLLLDAGSGPFTLPLALWICMPEWRKTPLSVLAVDSARRPLELGKALFTELMAITGQAGWQIRYETGVLEDLPKLALPATGGRATFPWLLSAANVLNEIKASARIAEKMENLLFAWQPLWQAGAQLLFVEPGTRLGGAIIMQLRELALVSGLYPASPCTHSNACPLPRDSSGLPGTWCHFVFSAQSAPAWLKELSMQARLFKTALTLAPLLLSTRRPEAKSVMSCRVISQSFPVEGTLCRYACGDSGLGLLPNSRNLPSGSSCLAKRPEGAAKDARSGAVILEPVQPPQAPVRRQPRVRRKD